MELLEDGGDVVTGVGEGQQASSRVLDCLFKSLEGVPWKMLLQ